MSAPATSAALEVRDLSVAYGGIRAVERVSFDVGQGEIVTLIGANGAGKSTTLKALVRLVQPSSGSVRVFGDDTDRLQTHEIIERGVALVPEGRAIFPGLTVRENLELGAYRHRGKTAEIRRRIDRAVDLFPRLGERLNQQGGTLSGGEQQMLAIGRGLMLEPQLLLLDEPSLGLAPKLVAQIFESILKIAESGITILLVEQNTRLALQTARRAYVLVTGEIALSGTCADLRHDARIRKAYLGEDVEV
jgi:branched-chain amino acid transport system ATP-binding protein